MLLVGATENTSCSSLSSFLVNSRLKSAAKMLNAAKRRDKSLCYISVGGKTCNKRKSNAAKIQETVSV